MELTIPVELREQFERDNVLFFVGEGINRGILPSSPELAGELAQRCDYPSDEQPSLPRVSGYYELTRDRNGLISFLRDKLDVQVTVPPRAHTLLVSLKPRAIVTTCYDHLLEYSLRQTCVPYTAVVGNQDVAFTEERKTLLIWMWGVLDQPGSLVITEDDHRNFLEKRANLSDVLRGELARRTWLFLGFDLEDEWFRSFYDTVQRGLDRYGRRAYVFGATPGAYTRLWWEKRNVSILDTSVVQFLETLVRLLTPRPQLPQRPSMPATEALDIPIAGSPYKRLDHYGEDDRPFFFGREQEVERLAALIHAHRLVLFYGASGTGKTSLMQAGVIPRLKHSDPGYVIISVRAVEDPRKSIRNAIIRLIQDESLAPTITLLGLLAKAAQRLGPIVLIIDQFEEFFAHHELQTRQQIITELTELYEAQDVPVKIVFTLREDCLAHMGELETHIAELFRIRFQLQPLTRNQARRAILGPVALLGRSYEPTLVDQLLDDLGAERLMPPQLQLVCSTLYDGLLPADTQITQAQYEGLGGTAGILGTYLSGELSRLSGPERTLARSILKGLLDAEGNKRVLVLEDLTQAFSVAPNDLSTVLEKLVRSHLVRPLDLEQRGEMAYELAHEYLITEIARWFDPQESERKRVYELLQQDVKRWHQFQTPIPGSTLNLVGRYMAELLIRPDERLLILRSAVQQGWDIELWVRRLGEDLGSASILSELLWASDETIRLNAARGWRYMPGNTIRDLALVEIALSDTAPSVRAEAAVTLAHRDSRSAVDMIVAGSNVPQLQQAEALALIWDETAPLRSLSAGIRMSTIMVLARYRLKRSWQRLLYCCVAGLIAAIVVGILFALLVGPFDWTLNKVRWLADGYTLPSMMALLLILAPSLTSAFVIELILSSILPLVLLRRPRRGVALLISALLAGMGVTMMTELLWLWGVLYGTSWQAMLTGFVTGSSLGGCVAVLFQHRHANGTMLPPQAGCVLGAVAGLVTGIITSFVPPRHDFPNFIFWLVAHTVGSTLIIGGVNLAVRSADTITQSIITKKTKEISFP
jgi:hypothetical protein